MNLTTTETQISALETTLANNWPAYSDPKKRELVTRNLTILPLEQFIITLQADDILNYDKARFYDGKAECFTLDQPNVDFAKSTCIVVSDTDLGINYSACESLRDMQITSLWHILHLHETTDRRFYIPDFCYWAFLSHPENYSIAPANIRQATSRYVMCGGSWFRNQDGDSVVPMVDPGSAGLASSACYLGISPFAYWHFVVLEIKTLVLLP
jgi:hypothetical protein